MIWACLIFKLSCFQDLFKDKTIRDWFAESSKQLLSDLLIKADRVSISYASDYIVVRYF